MASIFSCVNVLKQESQSSDWFAITSNAAFNAYCDDRDIHKMGSPISDIIHSRLWMYLQTTA